MSTSVKMRDADKRRLDRLQAELTARFGRKLSQQDLLGRLVAMAEVDKERILGPKRDRRHGRSLKALLSLPMSTRRPTREADIDRDLYGGADP
ncbi:MAG: hypothetical protein ACT4PT_04395 [Methanobacteriota archaeon]